MLGFKVAISIAGLVGLIGGILFGTWDSVTVIYNYASYPIALRDIFLLAIYSVAIYAVLGCLGMAAIGVVSGGVIRIGGYRVSKSQLAGIFIGVFVLLAAFAFLVFNVTDNNIISTVGITVICILSGVGLAGLIVYVLDKGLRKERLVACSITLLVWLLVIIYGGLWVNFSLLSEEAFFRPLSLLTNVALLLLASLMSMGLYILFLSMLKRYDPRRVKQAGYSLLLVMLCTFIIISSVGPFSVENATKIEVLVDSEILKGKPNILWIVTDTVRADHLSSYGYERNTTPNIDRIASEGILYENAISTAPWTLPSHASMFTGMFPSKHGADAEHLWLDDGFQTIAEVLRLHGYKTFAYSNNPFISHRNNTAQGFDTLKATAGKRYEGMELAERLRIHRAVRFVQKNLRMDQGAQSTNKVVKSWITDANQTEAPFFIFINYMEAHDPYQPPKSYAEPYLSKSISFSEAMEVNQDEAATISGKVQISDKDLDVLRALYDGEISYLDFRIGQLVDYLRELNILDNTVLIINADHGENFGDHNLMEHILCVYDTLLHVPLVIRYPALFEAGSRVGEQVQLTDIYPTILDIVGIDWDSEEIQGFSLLRKWEERERKFAIAEHAVWGWWLSKLSETNRQFDVSAYARRLMTIRTEEFKYIWASNRQDELYNIRQDSGELNNLIEARPEKASELRALLKEWLNSFENYRQWRIQQVP